MNGTQILFDRESTDGAEYVGVSASGTLANDSEWQIKKVVYDADEKPVSIKYANGQADYAFKWVDRTTLSYS